MNDQELEVEYLKGNLTDGIIFRGEDGTAIVLSDTQNYMVRIRPDGSTESHVLNAWEAGYEV